MVERTLNGWRRPLALLPALSLAAGASAVGTVSPITAATPAASSAPSGVLAAAAVAAVLLLCGLFRFRRKSALVCPACGSRKCARVGQVGACRNGYRCHTCGYLWEPEFGALVRPPSGI